MPATSQPVIHYTGLVNRADDETFATLLAVLCCGALKCVRNESGAEMREVANSDNATGTR